MRRGILCSVLALLVLTPSALVLAQGGMSVDGEVRLRTEYKGPFDYSSDSSDDGTFMRTHLNFGWAVSEDVAFSVGLQDSRAWGNDGNGDADVDVNTATLSLSNVQKMGYLSFLGSGQWDLHLGRMNVPTYGDGYVLAANDWSNTGPDSYDGFHLAGGFGDISVEFIWADSNNANPYDAGAQGAAQGGLWYYLTLGWANDMVGVDAYLLTRRDNGEDDGDALTIDDVDSDTMGFRASITPSQVEGLEVVIEFASQETENDGDSGPDGELTVIRAGYGLDMGPLNHIGIGMSEADEGWNQAGDWNHGLLGHYDIVNNSNVEDFFVTLRGQISDFAVNLDFHTFTAVDTAAGADDDIGSEIDLYTTWDCGESLAFQAGWSMFSPGDALLVDEDGDFFYVQMTVPFGGN
jgi:hypothetical protein